jgi:hypothetical protein
MKRISCRSVAPALGLASLMLAAPSVGAQHGHPPPHPGSVHYGGRIGPVVIAPPVAVHYEHHVVAPGYYRGVYRNPYTELYFGRFRPGYRPIVIGGAQFYIYPALPVGFTTVVVNGITYYLFNGVYYQPYIYEGTTQYMVVPPPVP